MQPRRVLLAFEPPDGGVAENIAQLGLHLRDHGWDPTVAGPRESTAYPRLEAAGIPISRIELGRGLRHPMADARALLSLSGLLRSGRFELLHAHASKAGALSRIAAGRRRVPIAFSPHCFAFVGEVSSTRRVFTRGIERFLGRRTAGIICVCEDERRQAIDAGIASPDRLYRVYNGVDRCPDDIAPEPSIARLRERGPVVGAIAVLRRQKRLDLLIDAAPAILDAEPKAQVAIVGNGPEKMALEAQAAALGLDRDPRFHLLDFNGSPQRYLAGLDLFILPSGWEAFPISVLEAMACGVPQVACDVGGTAEAVAAGETGLLVEPAADSISRAVIGLLRSPDRRAAMAAASRRRQRERFTVEQMVADTVAVYDAVMANAGT